MSDETTTPTERVGRPPTLFVHDSGTLERGEIVTLAADEAAHIRSLRLRPGAKIELTDGKGGRWSGHVEEIGRRATTVVIDGSAAAAPPPPFWLCLPVGNRDRTLWLVEKAVEIGVSGLRFVEFERSRSVADGGRSTGFLDRVRRRAIAALKQSGGSVLPVIEGPVDLVALLAMLEEQTRSSARWVATQGGPPIGSLATEVDLSQGVILLVGPEGGLSPAEEDACARAGFARVGLGPSTLRFETAALVGLAVVASALDSRGPQYIDAHQGTEGGSKA